MPYTEKERKLMKALIKQYGASKAIRVYHAMVNSGKHDAIFGKRTKNKRNERTE